MNPLVSVVLPFHDTAAWLVEAVESIRSQTYDRWELLCIDDGSTDGSADIVARFARFDPRIRLVRLPRGGIVAALNHGIRAARGEFVARMDGDDVALPRRLELQVARLRADRSLAAVGGAFHLIDVRGAVWKTQRPPTVPAQVSRALERGNCLCHSSMLVRRSALAGCDGPYRGQFPLAEDYDLWLRLAERSGIGTVPEVVQAYRRDLAALQPARIARQAVAALGAWHAATARRAGREDPADAWHEADRETLERAGIPAARQARAIRRVLLAEARLARKRGFAESSRALARHAAALAPRGEGLVARLDYAWRAARVLLPSRRGRPGNERAAAGCDDRRPGRPSALPAVGHVEQGPG